MTSSGAPTSSSRLLLCAWCARVIRHGPEPAEHGICGACSALEVPIETLTVVPAETFDRLPFGIVRLTGDGRVESYNSTEAARARRAPDEVIGKHFFTEVAPCTNVRAFAGRLEAMRVKGEPASERFGFVFRLPWTHCTVELALTYDPATDRAVVIVDWSPADGASV